MTNLNDFNIKFTARFNKQRKTAPLAIREAFQETLKLFLDNPSHLNSETTL